MRCWPTCRRVAFIEDEVDNGQHSIEPLRHLVGRGNGIGYSGIANLPLGPDQPLRHRCGRNQERPRYLLGFEAAEGSQREGHL